MTPDEELTTEEQEHLWKRRNRILSRAELSSCYHKKRERFFDLLDKSAKAIAVIGGSAAFAKVGGPDLLPWIAATVTVTSTLSLVGSFSEKSRRYSELASKFCMLTSKIVAKGDRDFAEEDLNEWESRASEIEASEPASLGALVEICQAELYSARGQPYELPPFWQRLLAHFIDFQRPSKPTPATM